MGVTEDLADALARDTIAAMRELGDDQLVAEVSKVLGASSQTTQEAFLTAVRVRLAESRARDFLQARRRQGAADTAELDAEFGALGRTKPASGGR